MGSSDFWSGLRHPGEDLPGYTCILFARICHTLRSSALRKTCVLKITYTSRAVSMEKPGESAIVVMVQEVFTATNTMLQSPVI